MSLSVDWPGVTVCTKEVEIFKRGDEIVIRKIPINLKQAFNLLTKMPSDFMSGDRENEPPQDRDF